MKIGKIWADSMPCLEPTVRSPNNAPNVVVIGLDDVIVEPLDIAATADLSLR
jgi:hypothetical protein